MTTAVEAKLPDFETPVCTLCKVHHTSEFERGSYHLNLLPPMKVARCEECGLLFLSPRPDRTARLQLLQGCVPETLREYSDRPANYAAVTDTRHTVFIRRVNELADLYKPGNQARALKILDIGASSGEFVSVAREIGWETVGLEPSMEGARLAMQRGYQFPRAVAERLPFGRDVFDIVHSHHVFEHLADPLLAAQEAYRVLRPGGLFFLEVPNQLDNVMFRRDMLFHRLSQRNRTLRSIHHLWFFSRHTLPRLLRLGGFHQIRAFDYYSWPIRGWRTPFALATRLAGRIAFGGDLLCAYGYK